MTGRGEVGTSLLELLIALTILGLLVVAVVGGMFTSIIVTDVDHRRAEVETVAVSAAEVIKDQSLNAYVPCANTGTYSPALSNVTLPDGWPASSVAVTAVLRWNGAIFAGGLCVSPAADPGLQRVSILVEAPDRGVSETVEVVKRNPA